MFRRKNMKKTIRIFAFILAISMCMGIVACGNKPEETTGTSSASATTSESGETTGITSGTDGTTATTDATSSGTVDPPAPTPIYNKLLAEKHGEYLTVKYNPAYCELSVSTKEGIGDSYKATVTVKMKDGYKFKGFSFGSGIANGKEVASMKTEYTFDVEKECTLFVNCAMTYAYHLNGGAHVSGKDTVEYDADVTYYKNPNSLPERGYFKRDGYVLVEYNTKADGTGEGTSLGSRPYVGDRAKIDLYCIWAKEAPASDFEYEKSGSEIKITGYKGSEKGTLAVPAKIDGLAVISIGKRALAGTKAETIVLPASVMELCEEAFADSEMSTLVITDAIVEFTGETTGGWGMSAANTVIDGCENLANLRINAVLYPLYVTYIESNMKYDYMLWAKDRKKIVYVAGSSGQFGFVAEDMEKALDDEYVVVNYGTNANISGAFWMEYLSKLMGEDDILLWAPEDGQYLFGNNRLNNRLWRSIECNYDIFRYVDIRNYTNVFGSFESQQKDKAINSTVREYDRFNDAINNNGDLFNKRDAGPVKGGFTFNQFPSEECIAFMNTQFDKMAENGVKVYISFAPMSKSVLYDIAKKTQADLDEYSGNVAKNYHGTVISDIADHAIDSGYFADSEWHMTDAGAHLRTEILIRELKAQLEKEAK